MHPRSRRKKRTESIQAVAGNRETDDDDEEEEDQDEIHEHRRRRDRSRNVELYNPQDHSSFSPEPNRSPHQTSYVTNQDERNEGVDFTFVPEDVALILEQSGFKDLIQLQWSEQLRYFINELTRCHRNLDLTRTQFEKQYSSLKRRLNNVETENERLISEHRSATKALLLYRNLLDKPEEQSSTSKSTDFQTLKLSIDAVLQENERLYREIQEFKTSDPVYEQVQMLESANRHLQDELSVAHDQNHRLKKFVHADEIKHLKSRLKKTNEECEQMKLLNRKLMVEIEVYRSSLIENPIGEQTSRVQQSSSSQVSLSSTVTSQRSPKNTFPSTSVTRTSESPVSPLTVQNLRQFDISVQNSKVSTILTPTTTEIQELNDHVRLLEQKLKQRDYELQTLQVEIEKGTSSIMSSIEDLCLASSSVSANQPMATSAPSLTNQQKQDVIEEYQIEIDQLHDKLDDLTRENQQLKNRVQEFDTIYEENEYLYAEKSRWNEEVERARVRELILEQEIRSLKEREQEFLIKNEATDLVNLNPAQLKIKIEWLYQTNNKLDLEVSSLRDQLDAMTNKCQDLKRDLIEKDKHYQKILSVTEEEQNLPEELIRLERIKIDLEQQLDKHKEYHQKIVEDFQEQGDRREEKYSSLYETILKLQSEYRQKELEFVHKIDEIIQERNEIHQEFSSVRDQFEICQQENKSLLEEIKAKDEVTRDLKLALTSSNQDTQTIYGQLRQLNTNLSELQENYDRDLSERDQQIRELQQEQKRLISNRDADVLKLNQNIVQVQNDNGHLRNRIEALQSELDKLHNQIEEKQNFIEQMQKDIDERSNLHVNINNQLNQENKNRLNKINELEQSLAQENQRKSELQRTIQELQSDLLKSRALAKESIEKCHELERRFHENDKHLEETIRMHWNESTEPTRRELSSLRAELIAKTDQITSLQQIIDDENLKKQRLDMKLKRLKEEYVNVRKELYSRIEENNSLKHELVECRLKNDYNLQLTSQTFNTLKTLGDNEPSTAVQLYIKEKTDKEHWQVKYRAAQQKLEQVQKSYESMKEKYKQRLREERELFERTKAKYLEHIRNVQRDLQETRQLIEKDAELKMSQESSYQQLIEERRQLLSSMVDKDAKVREMRRENLLLTSKIQLLEDQMENLNDRVDRKIRARSQTRREINIVRYDSNLSIDTGTRSSSNGSPSRTTTYHDPALWNQPVHHKESFGFGSTPLSGASPK